MFYGNGIDNVPWLMEYFLNNGATRIYQDNQTHKFTFRVVHIVICKDNQVSLYLMHFLLYHSNDKTG